MLRLPTEPGLAEPGLYFQYYVHCAFGKGWRGRPLSRSTRPLARDAGPRLDYIRRNCGPAERTIALGLPRLERQPEHRNFPHRTALTPRRRASSRVSVRPHLGQLRGVSGSVPHLQGSVDVRLEPSGSGFTASVALPQESVSGQFEWRGACWQESAAGREPISGLLWRCSFAPFATATSRLRAKKSGWSVRSDIPSTFARSGYINLLQPQDRRSKQPRRHNGCHCRRGGDCMMEARLRHWLHAGSRRLSRHHRTIRCSGCRLRGWLLPRFPGRRDRFRRTWRGHLDSRRGCRRATLSRVRVDCSQCRPFRAVCRRFVLDRLIDHGADERRGVPEGVARRWPTASRRSRTGRSHRTARRGDATAWTGLWRRSRNASR